MSADRVRRVEVSADEIVVAVAEVTLPPEPDGPVVATFTAAAGHLPVGSRSELVDAVLDDPQVREHSDLDATVPLGDAETLLQLDRRTEGMTARSAGSTALIHAQLPSDEA